MREAAGPGQAFGAELVPASPALPAHAHRSPQRHARSVRAGGRGERDGGAGAVSGGAVPGGPLPRRGAA